MNKNTVRFIGPASLLLIGLIYGLSAVITKYLSQNLNAYQVVEYRFGIALLGAIIVLLVSRQKLNFAGVNKVDLSVFALAFPAATILFALAIFNGSVALAVFAYYLANIVAQFVIGKVFFKEVVGASKVLALVFIVLALVFFTDPFHTVTLNVGFILGVIGGVFQAITATFQKRLSSTLNRTTLLTVQALSGFIIAATILLFSHSSLTPSLGAFSWLLAFVFGLGLLIVMYLFLIGYKHTSLSIGSVLVSSTLFFGPFFAYLFLGEHLSMNVLVGGLLTGLAVTLSNVGLAIKRTPKAA